VTTVSESKLVCVKCGYNLTGVAVGSGCPECGEPMESSIQAIARPGITPPTAGAAITAMVLGITGLAFMLGCGFFALPLPILAVVFGHVARAKIARSAGTMQGAGMAMSGLIMGYVGIALMIFPLLLLLGFFAVDQMGVG
jgi:hypothetical protein